ncbi:hypothetical protein A1O3_10131 [Capronia epimyces CBS 606.96]|uniref:C2H2-type domain-containing protein n=1 Tax=Capronia epimyces CBS 606.96 TaxID=1182542 RepID=W9Y3E6_9EURO|nr:uncharacterized protein A1O3_10131 [Capronia epimyces CBS 606.96]EXJ76974.1 hypothetical protein A1O3_10131 [Capronia epimyces CBS 606.96]
MAHPNLNLLTGLRDREMGLSDNALSALRSRQRHFGHDARDRTETVAIPAGIRDRTETAAIPAGIQDSPVSSMAAALRTKLEDLPQLNIQNLDSRHTEEKLFACPFAKHDKSRYSKHNKHEKQYRVCTRGIWPDISRLKQHLFRVHWRGIHCVRCFTEFDNKSLRDAHIRTDRCLMVNCPYPEKFAEVQYNEIRRKRPTSTPEQVWYTIYGILFPSQPQPENPYANNVNIPPLPAPPDFSYTQSEDWTGTEKDMAMTALSGLVRKSDRPYADNVKTSPLSALNHPLVPADILAPIPPSVPAPPSSHHRFSYTLSEDWTGTEKDMAIIMLSGLVRKSDRLEPDLGSGSAEREGKRRRLGYR